MPDRSISRHAPLLDGRTPTSDRKPPFHPASSRRRARNRLECIGHVGSTRSIRLQSTEERLLNAAAYPEPHHRLHPSCSARLLPPHNGPFDSVRLAKCPSWDWMTCCIALSLGLTPFVRILVGTRCEQKSRARQF